MSVEKCPSSAKDQLTGSAVAVKKIMKPFSTPVLSKRTYRELKLLKHLRHENVRIWRCLRLGQGLTLANFLKGHQPQRYLHLTVGGYVSLSEIIPRVLEAC